MTPKEKAGELVERYSGITREYEEGYGYSPNIENAKICALIAVDVIIFELKIRNCSVKYFEEVKQEIEKL